MRKRRERMENPKTLDLVGEDEVGDITCREGKGFFACYLLTSLSPRHKGHTYIGFTVNPRRRIRQHNGEITSGAWRTKSRRPWEMVLCIYGFPTNVSALQFEWAWQHPRESLAVREAAAAFRSFSGVGNKIKLAYTMLNLPAWQSLSITVNYFSTKYTHHGALCPSLPEHMKARVCSMEQLPCFTKVDGSPSGDEQSFDAEKEDDNCSEGSNQSKPVNTTDAASNSNSSPSDLLMVDGEICNKEFERLKESETAIDDSLAKVSSFCIEETAEDANSPAFVPKDTTEPERQTEKISGSHVNGEDQWHGPTEKQTGNSTPRAKDWPRNHFSTLDEEVEVIDLLTPSPSCRAGSISKKRRVAEIIDLTRSPNFIQL